MANTQLHLIIFIVLNIVLCSNTQYIGSPRQSELQAVLKHSIELKCVYTGSDSNGGFVDWYKNFNESVSSEKPGHYIVRNTDKESILIIKLFVQSDSEVRTWSVKTNKRTNETPKECQFRSIALKSSPQGITGDRKNEELDTPHKSIRRNKGNSVDLTCIIKPDQKSAYDVNPVVWKFSKDDKTYKDLPDGVRILTRNKISIKEIGYNHRGFYRCTLNNVSFTTLLRVKDPLAPLWPFLGIVGIIVLLVLVIIIFEKRQKNAKKATTAYDEHTHANDPLVRSTDNETKKRVIKS